MKALETLRPSQVLGTRCQVRGTMGVPGMGFRILVVFPVLSTWNAHPT